MAYQQERAGAVNGISGKTVTAEWRDHWPLVLAGLVGYTALGLQSYGFSPFVTHVENAFGWTRTEAMIGVSASNFVGIFLNILIGLLVDRIGARRVGIAGLILMTGGFALLGTATGTKANWLALWLVIAIGVVLTQSTVWTRAIARNFNQSRGLAMAVVLCGAPLSAAIVPLVSTWLIASYGWRGGFLGVGVIWLLIAMPVIYFLFHDDTPYQRGVRTPATAASMPAQPGYTFGEGLRTRAFFHLLISFGCFSFYSMTIATNLVPILSESGIDAIEVGGIASVMGIAGICARLSVGVLLDRYPGSVIGAITLVLPVVGCAILLLATPSPLMLVIAVVSFGAAIGAEVDVALYLATRHFGLKAFAALFGAIITFGAVNAAIGPIVAGWLHDILGSYDPLLVMISGVMSIGAVAMATIGAPREAW